MIEGYYYLHINGELIFKRGEDSIVDIRESDFCRAAWTCDPTSRLNAWNMLIEALSLGAKKERIMELARKWNCDDEDAQIYASYAHLLLDRDGDKVTATRFDFTNLQECPCGFGDTALEAMADLCKQLGFEGGKMNWHASFMDLLKI